MKNKKPTIKKTNYNSWYIVKYTDNNAFYLSKHGTWEETATLGYYKSRNDAKEILNKVKQ